MNADYKADTTEAACQRYPRDTIILADAPTEYASERYIHPCISRLATDSLAMSQRLFSENDKSDRLDIIGYLCEDLVRVSDQSVVTQDTILALTEHYISLLSLCRDFSATEIPTGLLEAIDDLMSEQIEWLQVLELEDRRLVFLLWVVMGEVTGEIPDCVGLLAKESLEQFGYEAMPFMDRVMMGYLYVLTGGEMADEIEELIEEDLELHRSESCLELLWKVILPGLMDSDSDSYDDE